MRILVLGGGVIGITSAWYLHQRGFDVTVIDRQPGPAMEASSTNAGQIAPSYAAPWAAPGIPTKALKWLFKRHTPLSIYLDGTLSQLNWLWHVFKNCDERCYQINKQRMMSMGFYSKACLQTLIKQTGIKYNEERKGILQLFRHPQQIEDAIKDMAILQEYNIRCRLLDSTQLADVEPALTTMQHKLVGGLHFMEDATGDCKLFARRLMSIASAVGVNFRFNTAFERLLRRGDQIYGVKCGEEVLEADAYVVASGSWSTPLLDQLVALPVYPVKGYSLTIPILCSAFAPTSSIMDETYKVAITRLDNKIRAAGMAELNGFSRSLLVSRRETLKMVVQDLYPGAGEQSKAEFWCGLRAMTPDGIPLVGRTPIANLFLNTGHGTLGWTMACGSGELLADIISQQSTAIDAEDYSVMRYL